SRPKTRCSARAASSCSPRRRRTPAALLAPAGETTRQPSTPAPRRISMPDLRHACRALLATPVVSLVAVLSLALGIGANTAIFSIIDSLLLRSLPVRAPDRLALLALDPTGS